MEDATVKAIALQLSSLAHAQKRPFSVVFHGGEPLLVGPARFESICRILRQMLPKECALHLQTNAVLLSERILQICSHHDVGISISIDGAAEVHNMSRVDHRGRGSHDKVMAGIRRLIGHPNGSRLFTGVLAVIDIRSDPIEVYKFLKSTGAPSVDFLYRDGNHDNFPAGKSTPISTEYGEWMARLLDYYLDDPTPTPIRVIDDMLRILIGGIGRKEGVGITDYGILVFETDGALTKNDTLKSASSSADQFAAAHSVFNCALPDFVASNEFSEYHRTQRPSSAVCKACSNLTVCGGGMPSHRFSKERGLANPSVFCADQRYLIERMRWHLSRRMVAA